jgi:hypothetical protein
MERKRLIALYMTIVLIIAIVIVYGANNTKKFDLTFPVDREQSDIQIDKVFLRGTLIRFPLNLYYIKGYLTIGDDNYKLANYRRSGFNPILKINTYRLGLIDKESDGYFNGVVFLNGDIIKGNLININVSIDIVDKNNGYPHSQVINTSRIQD